MSTIKKNCNLQLNYTQKNPFYPICQYSSMNVATFSTVECEHFQRMALHLQLFSFHVLINLTN